ncbi:MAG: nucleotidyltransferase domain-containing protein [Desulfobacterales bacterium]|nr:nucleotidyltransferase domain-containing protein [Desulfobacterales bacterium]MCF8078461.1 nucleotidyltransferase domain-containing protein [Desulfobacterales bacterium]
MNRIDRIRSDAREAFAGSDTVLAVYLFGSMLDAETDRRPRDIDLAFLLDEAQYKNDPLEASSDAHLFAARLSGALEIKTDIVILNGASLEMAYEIITRGRAVYVADEDRRTDYECKVKGLYFDFKPFLEELRKGAGGKSATGEL